MQVVKVRRGTLAGNRVVVWIVDAEGDGRGTVIPVVAVIELTEEMALPGQSGRTQGRASRWVSEWEPADGD